jgi:uncharacterized membrane-anchored protein
MSNLLRALLFAVMSAAILATPASQIVKHERVLREGRAFKFRTRPVDPYDAFRGRYVQLSFDDMTAVMPVGMAYRQEMDVFVRLGETNGFAFLESISESPPADRPDYVKVELGWYVDYPTNRRVTVRMPFTQFFMNEKLAPAAEQAYRDLNRRGTTNVWAVVRVLNGKGVIENLMFDGVPAKEYLTNKERP